jgi:hypothetical protein
MENIFVVSAFIAGIYLVFKFLEMRIYKKENKPVKEFAKDGIIIYLCACLGLLGVNNIFPIAKTMTTATTKVFTDSGNF